MQILIGPNGSGKSNFVEILNQIYKNILFKRCFFDKTQFDKKPVSELKKRILTARNQEISHLSKCWGMEDKEQKISFSISLNEIDHKNIEFVINNAEMIDKYFFAYSSEQIQFKKLIEGETDIFLGKIRNKMTIDFVFMRGLENDQFIADDKGIDVVTKFIKEYFRYYNFIQSIIEINNFENKNRWSFLKNTFALVGCYRNYNSVKHDYSAGGEETQAYSNILNEYYQDSTLFIQSTEEPIIFKLFKHRIAYEGRELFDNGYFGKIELIDFISKNGLLKSVKEKIKKFLSFELVVEIQKSSNWNFLFSLKDGENEIPLESLSAGQKSILHLIFALYAYEIENGLMIIDEPELHLHPQLQKKYLDIINEESVKRKIQFIMATHSSAFVNEKNITNVKRFYMHRADKCSKTVSPGIILDDKDMTRFLSLTNSSKIFFVDKVILVEGDTDEYFFNFYFKKVGFSNSNSNWEILDINGKDNYNNWYTFLRKWGLQVFYIGDWDNVVEMDIISKKELLDIKNEYKLSVFKKIMDKIDDKNSKDGKALFESLWSYVSLPQVDNLDKLKELLLFLFDRYTPYKEILAYLDEQNKKEDIDKKIEQKYDNDIFILKNGELEDYLEIDKGLKKVVAYCDNFRGAENVEKLKEIDEITKKIFLK